MKGFRERVNEILLRSVHNEGGDLEELKFDKVHVATSTNKNIITIDSTSNILELKNK